MYILHGSHFLSHWAMRMRAHVNDLLCFVYATQEVAPCTACILQMQLQPRVSKDQHNNSVHDEHKTQ